MRKSWVLIILLFCSTSSGASNIIGNYFGNKPSTVSMFGIGTFTQNTNGEYVVEEIHNILVVGNGQQLETLVMLNLSTGLHNLELVLSHTNGKSIKAVKHGSINVTEKGHTHSLYSKWEVNIPAVDELCVVVVDTFNGKRYNINTFTFNVDRSN